VRVLLGQRGGSACEQQNCGKQQRSHSEFSSDGWH
jgi:hypothetical protein